jgi:cytochrome c oxidase subunit 2
VVFVLGLRTMTAFPLHDGEHRKPEIRIIGRQWWWEVHYLSDSPHQRLVTANEIHIPTGRPVEFELESADVIHSFWIPKLHGKVALVPGMRNCIRLQADQPGATPRSPEAVHRQELFVSRACGLCHTIRGTDALGGVGPDLPIWPADAASLPTRCPMIPRTSPPG